MLFINSLGPPTSPPHSDRALSRLADVDVVGEEEEEEGGKEEEEEGRRVHSKTRTPIE